MMIYEIWTPGGWSDQGMEGRLGEHQCIASGIVATSFIEACRLYMNANDPKHQYYNPTNNTYWGLKLFPTEQDAIDNSPNIYKQQLCKS